MTNLERATAYLRAIEARDDSAHAYFAPDVIQQEFPNRLVPGGATRDRAALIARQRTDDVFKAMIEVVLDQRLLGLSDRLLDRVKLLGEVKAWAPGLDHLDDLAQMALRPLQALGDLGMALVEMAIGHG